MKRVGKNDFHGVLRPFLASKNLKELGHYPDDVVFALFLEPHDPAPNSKPSVFDQLLSFAVANLQPRPAMTHVELVVPCAPGHQSPVHFATYIGETSGWQTDHQQNRRYYLQEHANQWLAVPVFGDEVALKAREACDKSQGVKYSLLRYLSAASWFRGLSAMMPDSFKSPAHCATLVARVLRASVNSMLRPSAWYGPASLFVELNEQLRERAVVPTVAELNPDSLVREQKLLGGGDAAVVAMGDAEALDAIRVLTLKVAAAAHQSDAPSQRILQKKLANGLLRWSVNRVTP